eukprot:SAG31_NODE_2607_length_5389_cov_1.257467_3_plen_247_part_00
MAALAKMATMQEHLTKDDDAAFDHVDALISMVEFRGWNLDRQEMRASDSAAFLAELHATCTHEHAERAAGRGVPLTEPFIMSEEEEDTKNCGGTSNSAPCRWLHLHGINFTAMNTIGTHFKLDPSVIASCKKVSPKASVSFNQIDGDHRYDHLSIIAHYLQLSDDVPTSDDEIQTFDYEQVHAHWIIATRSRSRSLICVSRQVAFVLPPDFNLLISIDTNGEKSLEEVYQILRNPCVIKVHRIEMV